MTRQQELNNFLSEIKDKKIFCDFWKKMEDFLTDYADNHPQDSANYNSLRISPCTRRGFFYSVITLILPSMEGLMIPPWVLMYSITT